MESADVVAAASAAADSALVRALLAADVQVEMVAQPRARDLFARVGEGTFVWVAGDADDVDLTEQLAGHVVNGPGQVDADEPVVEILVGSFDPAGARLLDLVEVMDRLRRECPWDQEQTHETLVRYLLEETYETVDAIESGDRGHLVEELGDLLLQVAFHARIAAEHPDEPFTLDDVAGQVVEKLIRRHPHVFADVAVEGVADVESNWETIKSTEKQRASAMDEIPLGLPALSLAAKVVSRTLRSGGVPSVAVSAESAYDETALGDALFALSVAATAAGLDPEQALRRRVAAEMDHVRSGEQRGLPGEDTDRR